LEARDSQPSLARLVHQVLDRRRLRLGARLQRGRPYRLGSSVCGRGHGIALANDSVSPVVSPAISPTSQRRPARSHEDAVTAMAAGCRSRPSTSSGTGR
jgi:hypothetical protein